MTQQVTRTQNEIQQAAICRCTDKATHEVFYAVKSDSQPDTWYQVRWNGQALRWQCNCPAMKPCKHERAVNEVLRERRARIAAQMGGEVPAIVARMQAEEDSRLQAAQTPNLNTVAEAQAFIAKVQAAKAASKPATSDADKRLTAPLNGNRGFSLLR